MLNILPYIIIAMFLAESVVAHDMAKKLKGKFCSVQQDSTTKRIRRFFKNTLFDPYKFYDQIIRYVINNYKKKHEDKRIHIVFDHMFSKDNYTVFMMTMRTGKQGIPLWFRCFRHKDAPEAFSEDLIKEGITYVSNLFDKEFDLIFLADRWFNSTTLLEHINSLGHTYCVRLKGNIKVKIDGEEQMKSLSELKNYKYHSSLFNNVAITKGEYFTNIAISKKAGVKEPWIIATNGDTKRAIRDYGYRYGAIETVFKNQKSNGFNLEKTVNSSLEYFTCEYMCACLGVLILTIIGVDFSKNTKCYKNVNITTHKISNGVKVRTISLFNVGLTLFNRAFNSTVYIRLPLNFILYDS